MEADNGLCYEFKDLDRGISLHCILCDLCRYDREHPTSCSAHQQARSMEEYYLEKNSVKSAENPQPNHPFAPLLTWDFMHWISPLVSGSNTEDNASGRRVKGAPPCCPGSQLQKQRTMSPLLLTLCKPSILNQHQWNLQTQHSVCSWKCKSPRKDLTCFLDLWQGLCHSERKLRRGAAGFFMLNRCTKGSLSSVGGHQ